MCFNNRHTLVDSKRLVWEYDLQVLLRILLLFLLFSLLLLHLLLLLLKGDEERELAQEENVVNATLEEYMQEAMLVRRSIFKVGRRR